MPDSVENRGSDCVIKEWANNGRITEYERITQLENFIQHVGVIELDKINCISKSYKYYLINKLVRSYRVAVLKIHNKEYLVYIDLVKELLPNLE